MVIRPMDPANDIAFISDSWVSSYAFSPSVHGVRLDDRSSVVSQRASHGPRGNGKGVRIARTLSQPIDNVIYSFEQRQLVARLVTDPDVVVDVLCDQANPDVILGWMASTVSTPAPIIHYIFVKRDFRRLGCASALMAHRGITPSGVAFFTHRPPHEFRPDGHAGRGFAWKDDWVRTRTRWSFNPYILLWPLGVASASDDAGDEADAQG